MSFRYYGAFTRIVVATVAVATTGPAVSTLYASLFSCCSKTEFWGHQVIYGILWAAEFLRHQIVSRAAEFIRSFTSNGL